VGPAADALIGELRVGSERDLRDHQPVREEKSPLDTRPPAREPGFERRENCPTGAREEVGDARRHAIRLCRKESVRRDELALSQSSEDSPGDDFAGAGRQRGLAEHELLDLGAAQKTVRPEVTEHLHVAGRSLTHPRIT
jgi:hypothetical protein